MLGFNINTNGVVLDSETAIRESLAASWKAAYAQLGSELNTDAATPNGQVITSDAAIVNNANQTMLWILSQMSPKTANGQALDNLCDILGIRRRNATATQITIRCYGAAGTVIYGKLNSAPSQVQDQASQVFTCAADTVIQTDGYTDVLFVADDGAIETAGTFTIKTVQPGWESITTPYPIIAGTPEETDASLRARYNAVFNQNGAGTVANICAYINNIAGVIYATGDENPTGTAVTPYDYAIQPHSYVISVLGGSNNDIAQAIYGKKSLASMQGNTTVSVNEPLNGRSYDIVFLRPSEIALQIQVSITDSLVLPSDIDAQINSICESVFNGKLEKIYTRYFATPYQSRIAQIVGVNQVSVKLSTDGETWVDSVQYDLDQYASLGDITINIA